MENKAVLLVDGNEKLNEGNRRALARTGYDALTARTLDEARKLLAKHAVEVILLEVMLPDGDGIDFCGEIQEKTDAHILFLTSRTEPEDRVRGLNAGGDDYITKPYDIGEMMARVAAAMRRRGRSETLSKTLKFGNLTLDIAAGAAFADEENLLLSAKEFSLLFLLAQNADKEVSKSFIYEKIWKMPLLDDSRSLRSHVCNLREKMVNAGCDYTINAVYGKGYCFEKY